MKNKDSLQGKINATPHESVISAEEHLLDYETTQSNKRPGFFGQLGCTMRRQIIQKRRRPCSLIIELMIPVVCILGMLLASSIADTSITPGSQPVQNSPPDKIDTTNWYCYNGTDEYLISTGVFPQCTGHEVAYICSNTSSAKGPIPVADLCFNANKGVSLYYSYFYEHPLVIFDMDKIITSQWWARVYYGLVSDELSATALGLRSSGKLYFVPENDDSHRLVDYLNKTSKLFRYVFGGFAPSRESLMDKILSLDNEGTTWAIVNTDISESDGVKVYKAELSLNRTAVPWTLDNNIRNMFVHGYNIVNIRQYIDSGFLALQIAINHYFMKEILGKDVVASDLPATTISPMGFIGYKDNVFFAIAGHIVPLLMVMSFLYMVAQVAKCLVEEKEERVREGTMVMGLGKPAFFSSWLFVYYGEMMILAGLSAIVLRYGLLKHSDGLLIFVLYALFGLSVVNLASLVSTLFDKSKVAALAVPLLYFAMAIPSFALPDGTAPGVYVLLSIFLSPVPFAVGNQLFMDHETLNGIGWNNAASPTDRPFNMYSALFLLMWNCFIYLVVMIYLDNVMPKQWGSRSHPLYCLSCFLCLCGYKKKHHEVYDDELREGESSPLEHMTEANKKKNGHAVENYPDANSKATIHMRCVRKEFPAPHGKKVAVNDIDLRMYPDSITVLLGHNGAGKTTLMNMITGMMTMTSGDVEVYGYSAKHDLSKVRGEIGFCPQHNILWNDLTCMEHLQYFARLKGVPSKHVDKAAMKMLKLVDLEDKRDVYSCRLSGGQKRKLSVAIAFIGGSRLVLLDEPTAGMDVAARRHTWELIQEMSAGRTILLTTHFMDEADLLGSRIAIMSKGALHSYGSPMFLKNRLGTGYVLRVSHQKSVTDAKPLMAQVYKHIPKATLREVKGQEVAIALPKEAAANFPSLIRAMESRETKSSFGITGVSMSVSTLEDVFLKIAHDEELELNVEPEQQGTSKVDINHSEATNPELQKYINILTKAYTDQDEGRLGGSFMRQLGGLMMKRLHFARRDRRTLVLQIILPLLCLLLAMAMAKMVPPDPKSMVLDYDLIDSTNQMISINNCGNLVPFYNKKYKKDQTNFSKILNFSEYLVDTFQTHGDDERLTSISCDDTYISNGTERYTTIFVNGTATHGAPIGVAEYYQAVARSKAEEEKKSTKFSMKIASYPLPYTEREHMQIAAFTHFLIAMFVLIPFTFIPSTYVSFVVKERSCKAKHLQFVSGVNFMGYWIANFLFDLLAFFVTMCIALIIFKAFDREELIGSGAAGATVSVFTLYGISGIFAAYTVSFFFNNHGSAQNVVMLSNFMIGFVLVLTTFVLEQLSSSKNAMKVLVFFFRFVPAFCLGEGLLNISMEGSAAQQEHRSPDYFALDCCGWDLIYMACSSIVYAIVTMIIDHPRREERRQKMKFRANAVPPTVEDEEVDVAEERRLVESGERMDDVITVCKLRKAFPLGYGKEKVAVQNLSFGVKKGEVFGFLGTNGAGKTTTMSMLTTEFAPTMGRATVAGFDVISESSNARKVIGYCPQFDALLDLLTPTEHLNLYCALRGIPISDVSETVNALITCCGLEQYRDVCAGSLSGGNKRKLSVAIALVGGPRVVFLDEPSAGMDPQARRQLWDVIVFIAKHSSVLLTTHHLEEVDVLAHRVGIMDQGLLKCLGSLEHLKRKFGGGFELAIKVATDDHKAKATEFITSTFPSATLSESHHQRLIFALPVESTELGALFEKVQKATSQSELGIQDYMVQQTTLEQVFMRITEMNARREEEEQNGEEGNAGITQGRKGLDAYTSKK